MNQYLAGVTVKIAEEWKPSGKRVHIPADLREPVLNDLSEQDVYDFKVERNALAFVSERRERRRKEAEERAAKHGPRQKPEAEGRESPTPNPVTSGTPAVTVASSAAPAPPPTAPVVSPAHAMLPMVDHSPILTPTAPAVPVTNHERRLDVVPFVTDSEKGRPGILDPLVSTHVLPQQRQGEVAMATVVRQTGDDRMRFLPDRPAVNLKDFEADAGSPFDQMELNTIDEVQELASVLQNTHISATSENHKPSPLNGFKPNQNSVNYFNNYSASFQTPAGPPYFVSNVAQEQQQQQQQTPNATWGVPSWYNYSGGVVQSQQVAIKGEMPYSAYPYYSAGSRLSCPEPAFPESQAIPLLDRPMNARSASVPRQPATNLNKVSSISVPNLSAELDSELLAPAQKPLEKIGPHSPRRTSERSRTPPAIAKRSSPPVASKPRIAFELPDVYSQMSWEVKTRVNHIAEMGFPRGRVARCWKKLKGDDKKVVEYLLLIQSLVDAGYPGEFAEVALDDLQRDQQEGKARKSSSESRSTTSDAKLIKQATQRICIMAQFSDLGFPMERIVAALRTTSWDRDKALDILLT